MEKNMGWLSRAGGVLSIFGNRQRAEIAPAPEQDLMIVRRGLSPAFYFFCNIFATERGMKLVPDRRVKERRRWQRAAPASDRRRNDRRSNAAPWPKEDFIIVRDRSRTPGSKPF